MTTTHTPPETPTARAATLGDQQAGQGEALLLRREIGGQRHYLDGHAVHCGDALELQAVQWRYDDDDQEHVTPLDQWIRVGYEASFHHQPPRVTLYADVGGHRAALEHSPGMRFRWPQK